MGWLFPSTIRWGAGPQNLTQYVLPNHLGLNNRRQDYSATAPAVVATARSNLRPSMSLTFQDATTLLYSTTVLRVPDSSYPQRAVWPDAGIVVEALECGIYFCVKEFDSRVENGVLKESSRDISSVRDPDSFQVYIKPQTCGGFCGTHDFRVSTEVDAIFSNETYFPRHDLSIQAPGNTQSRSNLYNVSQAGIDGLSSYVLSLFDEGTFNNVSVTYTNYGPCNDKGSPVPCAELKNVSGMAIGSTGNPGDPETAQKFAPATMEIIWGAPSLTAVFENLANSITNEMRKNKADQAPSVAGRLGVPRTILQVRWQWITLPALLLIVSSVFFLLTIIESRRSATPLWKGSGLAVLYHGLEAKVRSTLEHWDLSSQMSVAAEEVKVKLSRDPTDDGNVSPWIARPRTDIHSLTAT